MAGLEAAVPDRRLFVLYALECAGRSDMFSEEEKQDLAGARDQLRAATESHPGLKSIIRCVDIEAQSFDSCWQEHTSSRQATIRPPKWTWRVAAAIMVVGLAGLFAYYVQRSDTAEVAPIAVVDSESILHMLPDGSEVLLIGSPTLTYDADAFDRTVYLEGQAFFDIVRGADPFVVSTPNAVTTVLGTRFGVDARNELTEVVLESGSIEVTSGRATVSSVVLLPGQMTTVEGALAPSVPANVDVASFLEWTGLMFFQATTMADVAARLEKAFDVVVDVDPLFGNEAVSGTFYRNEGPHQILSVLAVTLGARVVEVDPDHFSVVPAV